MFPTEVKTAGAHVLEMEAKVADASARNAAEARRLEEQRGEVGTLGA